MNIYIATLVLPVLASAIPAYPAGWTCQQPDKSSIGGVQVLIGTPAYHFSVYETYNGTYTTVKDKEDGFIKFAVLDTEGRFAPSKYIAGKVDEADLPKLGLTMDLIEDSHVVAKKCEESDYCMWHAQHNGASHASPPAGKKTNLVIPIIFKNHKGIDLMIGDMEQDLFNDDYLSVKDYFLKQSYGKLSLTSEIAKPVTLEKTEAECTVNMAGLTRALHDCLMEAVDAVKENVNSYDIVTFMHSGRGAEFGNQDIDGTYYDDRVWSHSWELPDIGRYAIFSAFYGVSNSHGPRLGTLVHEIGQALGIPTMYGGFPGFGLGFFDSMASPYGFDGTLSRPGSMSAYTKMRIGWADVVEVKDDGPVSVEAVHLSNKIYKISNGFSATEYLLIENRQAHEYDEGIRQGGLVIYHIDETANNVAGHPGQGILWPANHYRAAVIQPDGRFDLELMESEGDKGHFFHDAGYSGINDFGVIRFGDEIVGQPTIQSYAGGEFTATGISIAEISASGDVMSFSVYFADAADEE